MTIILINISIIINIIKLQNSIYATLTNQGQCIIRVIHLKNWITWHLAYLPLWPRRHRVQHYSLPQYAHVRQLSPLPKHVPKKLWTKFTVCTLHNERLWIQLMRLTLRWLICKFLQVCFLSSQVCHLKKTSVMRRISEWYSLRSTPLINLTLTVNFTRHYNNCNSNLVTAMSTRTVINILNMITEWKIRLMSTNVKVWICHRKSLNKYGNYKKISPHSTPRLRKTLVRTRRRLSAQRTS